MSELSLEQRISIFMSVFDSFDEEEFKKLVKEMEERDPNDIRLMHQTLNECDCVDVEVNYLNEDKRGLFESILSYLREQVDDEPEELAEDLDFFVENEVTWKS